MPEVIDARWTAAATFDFATPSSIPSDILDRSRDSASAVGYAQGWSYGVREARAELAAERAQASAMAAVQQQQADAALSAAIHALASAAAQLEDAARAAARPSEDAILAAAVEIAEALLGQQLRDVDHATSAALARVLQLAPGTEPVLVRLNTDVHAQLQSRGAQSLLDSVAGTTGRTIRFEADPTLAVGDAVASSGATTVDARLDAGIQLIREHLARTSAVTA